MAKNASKAAAGRGVATARGKASMAETPSAGALSAWEDLDRFFDDFLERRWPSPFEWPKIGRLQGVLKERAPAVDVVDRDNEIIVRAEVPGVDKKDLDVSITERRLTIKGQSRHEEKREEDDYFRHEIRSGSFSRSVLLPSDVDASKAKTSFENGVVELRLPKVKVTRRHKISVS